MIAIKQSYKPPFKVSLLKRAAEVALSHQAGHGNLTIVLTDDAQLQELNRDYLGVDAPTDVLSFPASETDPDAGAAYLGDILLSVPRAEAQARSAGHPAADEAQLLVVHGVLHLLGHDHGTKREKAKMWKAQAAILLNLGLEHVTIREE